MAGMKGPQPSEAFSFSNQYTPNLGMLENIYNYNYNCYTLSSVTEVVQYMKSFFLGAKTHDISNLQIIHLEDIIMTTTDL